MRDLMLWLRYLLVWPGLKRMGFLSGVDNILVLAFGRRGLAETKLSDVRKIFNATGQNDFATVLALRKQGFNPGKQNQMLAEAIQGLCDRFRKPTIAQWEVACALGQGWHAKHQERIICLWPPENPAEYFSSRRVLKEALIIMKENGWSLPFLLAHQRQITRLCLMLKKLGINPIVDSSITKINGFDPNSVQHWTRSGFLCFIREIKIRIRYILHGFV